MSTLRCLWAVAILAGSLTAAKTPLTHEAMWLMKRVGNPIPSPDGRWAVFAVITPSYDEAQNVSDLFVVPTDGSAPPRQITFTKNAESGMAWSPDSGRLAFNSRREGDEAGQLYVLDFAGGGEAVRLTTLVNGASSPRWSPDGKMLLFSSNLFPGAATEADNARIAAERKARKYRARVYDSFPVRNWDRWLDDLRPGLFVVAAEPGTPPRSLLNGSKLAQESGFGGAAAGLAGQDLQGAWAPDGQSIVFTATTNRSSAAYANVVTHLYQVPLAGGEPRQLTTGTDASYASPTFSPDGKALYCLHSREGNRVYSLNRLAMFRWPGNGQGLGERTLVTDKLDRSVSSFDFTPDSRRIYLLAEEAGHDKLFTVGAQGGEATRVFDLAEGIYANIAIPDRAASPLLLATYESATSPAEVVRIDPAARRHTLLSRFNVELASQVEWGSSREFWFTSKAGRRIHNLVTLPPNFDANKKYPLFTLIHGGPHTMAKDQFLLRWHSHLLSTPGYVILQTNYTGSTGFGEAFAQAIQGDPLKGPGEELNEAVDAALREYPFLDATRVAAGGASYGGHLANWLQATTTRYKCLISHAGLVNLETQWGTSDVVYSREINNGGPVWEQGPVWREQNPIRYAARFKTPILVTVGENDFRVPLNNSLENWSVLQRLRIPSRLIVFPDENHWILKGENSRFFYQEVLAWLKQHLA